MQLILRSIGGLYRGLKATMDYCAFYRRTHGRTDIFSFFLKSLNIRGTRQTTVENGTQLKELKGIYGGMK